MVDAKVLNPFMKEFYRDLSYENMVKIYDKYCDGCPFADIRITKSGRNVKECQSVDEAIHDLLDLTNNINYHLHRGCKYGGILLSLREIVTNTCRFWSITTCEGGDNELQPAFIEVEKIEEFDVHKII